MEADTVGPLLRSRRQAARLSQEELAELTGLSVRTIGDLERGARRPHRQTLALIGRVFDLDEAARTGLAGTGLAGTGLAGTGPANQTESGPRREVPRQLPAAVRGFVGRKAELAALTRLLDRLGDPAGRGPGGGVVIAAIAGTAGVGKTALAIRWAHQVAGLFPDGQLYVNLRGYDVDQPVLAADALGGFLRALGVPGPEIPADPGERASRYRSLLATRRMLVVLDNAGQEDQVRPLLPGSATCPTVVTSRDALTGLVEPNGAARIDLGLLPPPDACTLLRTLLGDRAAADPPATVALASRCARLPLALRVAAEQALDRASTPLAELAGELADQQRRLDLLDVSQDPRTAVRGVFSWSYRRLDPGAARGFRLLGLHPGPDCDPRAFAALTATSEAEAHRVLCVLARAHLAESVGHGRYGLHDLLRAYACELAAGQDGEREAKAALTRLFDHHLQATTAAIDLIPLATLRHF
jgi:transcriptional regulator with XRE-family HTH domain